jgi:chemotaxis family two-component system response regulator Rcp1
MSKRLAVLLAEDNPGDVFLVREALLEHRLDFELYLAGDGDKLTALLERIGIDVPGPDVLLLDLNLPCIDGPDLFRRVRAHPLCAHAPLIVVSSSDAARDHAWTSEFGVSHYFRKPSHLDEFLQLGAIVRKLTS